jgi:hypothetical protein
MRYLLGTRVWFMTPTFLIANGDPSSFALSCQNDSTSQTYIISDSKTIDPKLYT